MRLANYRFILLPLFLFLACVGAFAQANSTVTGIVTDQTGAVVGGAQITLTDPATSETHKTVSGGTGLYDISGLNPATYNLKITAKGFQAYAQTGIGVTVSGTFRVDVKLTVGAESQTVTVEADALQVQADSNVVSTLISSEQISEIATENRNFAALEALGLGVSSALPDSNTPTSVAASFTISVNGLRQSHNIWLIDGGEADEKERLDWILRGVVQVFEQIIVATTWLTSLTAGFGWLAIVAPILVAAPSYFYGDMTFGKLMMIIGAFNQVQQALGWFANNFSGIADWRATLLRVVSFRSTLLTIDNIGEGQSQIELDGRHEESIVIDQLWIATPNGRLALSEPHLEVKPGDHVLITGERDAERALFQAIAGLWPWGAAASRGRIASRWPSCRRQATRRPGRCGRRSPTLIRRRPMTTRASRKRSPSSVSNTSRPCSTRTSDGIGG